MRALGRYVLFSEIASGGQARVFLGHAVGAAGFSRPVAVKQLHAHLAADAAFAAMFLDEARLAARVRHPNVVPTLDVVSEGGELFLVMEYVVGESLATLLGAATRAGLGIPPRVALGIAVGALQGLHAAHEARGKNGLPLSLVHRDVSPQNILVGDDGIARVIDFGIAKASERSYSTPFGQMKGKLRYMAPEQLQGAPATRRSDLYAAGVVLWEALTLEKLFAGGDDAVVLGRILEGRVPPPSSRAPLPAALDAAVMRALERAPEARFATAQEMAAALAAALEPALSAEIAAWVTSVAGESLRARARLVQEMERGEGEAGVGDGERVPTTAPAVVPAGALVRGPRGEGARPEPTATVTVPRRSRITRAAGGVRRRVVVLAVVALVVAVVAWWAEAHL